MSPKTYSISRTGPDSPLQSKSNDNLFLFAFSYAFSLCTHSNNLLWSIFSVWETCILLLSPSPGRWGSALEMSLLRRTMLQIPWLAVVSQNFIITKTTVFNPLCMPSLPLPGCLGLFSAAGLQTELALCRDDLICTPHSCRAKLCALRSKRQISGEFICSHMNSKWAFNTPQLQRVFALWEMPKYEVCISLLGMRNKMHNPSNKDTLETA